MTIQNEQPSLALTEAIAIQGVFPGGSGNPYIDFLAALHMFAFNFIPGGMLAPDGQQLSVSSHTALYALMGSTWGGDGSTVFDLPDLRGRLTVGNGDNPYTNDAASAHWMGQTYGEARITLATGDLPSYYGG